MKTIPNVFSNADITVTYNPSQCINAERCAKELSAVFRNSVIPWIDLDAASTDLIVKQINRCPSAALKFQWRRERVQKTQPSKHPSSRKETIPFG
jgi:uncharacterized Fe-S cluster protein YjdI